MRIITKYPIIKNGRVVKNKEFYSNGEGDPVSITTTGNGTSWNTSFGTTSTPAYNPNQNAPKPIVTGGVSAPKVAPKDTVTTKSLGKKFDKKKVGKGIMSVLDAFSSKEQAPVATQEQQKKGMSTTTKVLIGVGGVAVLGTIIYLIAKK